MLSSENVHEQASVQNPQKSNQPALRCVSSHGRPAKHHVERELCAGHQRAEQHEHQRGDVEDGLERGDLAEDLEGRQLCQRARPRGSPPSRHLYCCLVRKVTSGSL